MPKTGTVRSAIRALQLLEAVNRLQVASVAQLQASTSLPKATIVRLAQTLVSEGYLRKLSRAAGYEPTERVLRLSEGFHHTDLVVAAARGPLDAFAQKHKWLANLQSFDRGAMRVRYATFDMSPLASDPPANNRRSPMLTTAHGQAYLAFCPDAERDMILSMLRASKNPANAPARDTKFVADMLADVQHQGYALRRATPRDRVVGLAVPVLTNRGVAATIGMRYFGSALRPADAVHRYLPALRNVAVEISVALAAARTRSEATPLPRERPPSKQSSSRSKLVKAPPARVR